MHDAVTGLNLESFLHLLRADFGAWATLGLILLVLALMAWTSWGSRKALRKCLVLSVVAHFGLVLYGGTIPIVRLTMRSDENKPRERLRQIRVARTNAGERQDLSGNDPRSTGPRSAAFAPWDRPAGGLALVDTKLGAPKGDRPAMELPTVVPTPRPPVAIEATAPTTETPDPPKPADPAKVAGTEANPPPPETSKAADDVAAPVIEAVAGTEKPKVADPRIRVGRGTGIVPLVGTARAPRRTPIPTVIAEAPSQPIAGPDPIVSRPAAVSSGGGLEPTASATPSADPEATTGAVKTPVDPLPRVVVGEGNVRRQSRPDRPTTLDPTPRKPRMPSDALAVARVTPSGVPALPEIRGTTGGRPITDVPEVYRTRLDPNRSALAFRAGANPSSEQAVERALDWLARHQDTDGRWDAATAKYDDGVPVKGDDDFTVHCPAGETCFGECVYWEADTALTGLSLLAYLGAGYTHKDGKYAQTVGKGIDFLLAAQKADGDLRGPSRAVGMYCHAMASIALCEAYALTGDERLRGPVERAIDFLVKSRAKDGLAWRYAPKAAIGDTSILGWVVMALKSAREVGISIPRDVPAGVLEWLDSVAEGENRGLARYQPSEKSNPTMSAEAWVCRQFLGVGGPGATSTEAASYLLQNNSDRGTYNLYYWYYGTLAMYQHGGDAWERWNSRVRDEIVRRQHVSGHMAGSWDPDDSPYGTKGGRIYCTALATLSLEVYYRYLRLYDEPKIPPALAPARTRTLGRLEPETNPPGMPR